MTIHLKRQIGRELARLEVELEQIKGRCQMTDFQSSSQPVVNNEEGRRSGRLSTQRLGCPVPRQQLLQPADRRVRNVGEDVGKPGLRVDVIELGAHDQRRHEGGTISTTIRSGEEP